MAILNTNLADLDASLLALKTSLGAAWANTVVMTMTEFGRTAPATGRPPRAPTTAPDSRFCCWAAQ